MNSPSLLRLLFAAAGVLCATAPAYASRLGGGLAGDPPAAGSPAEPHLKTDPMPAFQGGDIKDFRRWVSERLSYPDDALARGIQGRVVVAFVVEPDGSVLSVEAVSSPDPLLSQEVVRVVGQSPAWTPGLIDGAPVRVWLSMPIDFNLQVAIESSHDTGMPHFQGGTLTDFKRWVLRHADFPADVFFPGDEGWVEAEFTVNKKGKVGKIFTHQYTDPDFARQIRKTIAASPLWTPGADPRAVTLRVRFDLLLKPGPEGLYTEDNTVYKKADPMPRFGSGDPKAFPDWVRSRVDTLLGPSVAPPPVKVAVRFVIERDGTMSDISVSAPSERKAFSKVVRRAVDDVPLWTPASLKGETVRCQMTQHIDFRPTEADAGVDSSAVEVLPRFFDGGLPEFQMWVAQTMKYPLEALKRNIRGRVVVQFEVDTTGSVTSVQILRSPAPILSAEVERVLGLAPRWTPGIRGGQPVSATFTIPIDFNVTSSKPLSAIDAR